MKYLLLLILILACVAVLALVGVVFGVVAYLLVWPVLNMLLV